MDTKVPIRHLDRSAAQNEHVLSGSVGRRFSPMRIALAFCLVALCLMALMIGVLAISQTVGNDGTRDYVEYWAAGQLLLHGGNPYDADATLALERSAGWLPVKPQITPSPPVIFFLVAPLGLVDSRAGAILWFVLLVAGLAISIHLLRKTLNQRRGYLHLLCYCFAPVLTCLMAGQIGIFLLLGIALFLNLYRQRPFWAGVALLVCDLKPHLFVPFGLVLLIWIIARKQHRILVGICAGVLATCVFALAFDPHAFSQYAHMLAIAQPTEPFVPTLSKMFRLLVHPQSVWLQFVPVAVACAWSVWYYWRRHNSWDWMDQGLVLLLVSVGCAPYAWFTDEAVLIPAILAGLYRARNAGRSLLPFCLIAGIALVELLKGIWMTTPYFVWTVPAWLGWYLYATMSRRADRSPVNA